MKRAKHERNARTKRNAIAGRKQRYKHYYQKIMEPVMIERWKNCLKWVSVLKKEILKLGSIPEKEIQLIKTKNYFVNFIDLLTNFLDSGGVLDCATEEKAAAVYSFNDILITLVAREECTICYFNKSKVGQRVTDNNLYLGAFLEITEKDDLNNIETREIHGMKVKVEVDFTPVSEWINHKAISKKGYTAKISQKTLAAFLNKRKSMLLEIIDEILK